MITYQIILTLHNLKRHKTAGLTITGRHFRYEWLFDSTLELCKVLFFIKLFDMSETEYLQSLLGRISYALQIDPNNTDMQQYFNDIKTLMNV